MPNTCCDGSQIDHFYSKPHHDQPRCSQPRMGLHTKRFIAIVLLSIAILLVQSTLVFASPALAKTVEPVITDAIMTVHIWLGAEPGKAATLVRVDVPESRPLPVRVRVPIPQGMKVAWAGEITSNVGEDLTRAYTTNQSPSGTYIEVIATDSHTVQVDFAPMPLAIKEGRSSTEVVWLQTVPAQQTIFDVRVPANTHDVVITPAPSVKPEKSDSGESLYSVTSKLLGEGESLTISVSYKEGSAFGVDLTNPFDIALFVLGLLLAGAMVWFVAALVRSRRG